MGNADGVIQAIDGAAAKNAREFLQQPEVQTFLANRSDVFAPHELNRQKFKRRNYFSTG